ncbi:LOB domain-containing protein 6 [Hibiscus syriacus]|uniref:LOB domain-containing protein 6 n=1 Tax=Hibiscus syriacus TaxID=106335 RepID=A0A6A3ALI6_HIBSY|nr:LOB domain-containing protein 6 [Hibiscus syriacus]
MSSSNFPCAACKFLRRKCTQECIFAPYFPPDNPQKFANVHKVFGASNVAKLLNELNSTQREDAVTSLAYEAEARLRDPVYGCVGLISILQQKLKQMQHDLNNAKKELATYIGPQAMLPILQPPVFLHHLENPSSSSAVMQHNMMPLMGISTAARRTVASGPLVMRKTQQQQVFKAQQQLAALIAAREQQEMLYEQHHGGQQHEIVRFNNGLKGLVLLLQPPPCLYLHWLWEALKTLIMEATTIHFKHRFYFSHNKTNLRKDQAAMMRQEVLAKLNKLTKNPSFFACLQQNLNLVKLN